MENPQAEALLRKYKAYIALERNLSANSVESYMHDMEMFAAWLDETHALLPDHAQAHHIEEFMAMLYDRGMTKTSQARILSGVRSFFNFLLYAGHIEALPTEFIDSPKTGRRLPDTLSLDEIDAILASVDVSKPEGHRNRAMLEMLYSCGLRVSELISVRLSDLFFDEGIVRVTGKGNKQRLVPMSGEVIKLIRLYLEQRAGMSPEPGSRDIVFLNRRGRKLTRVMVFYIMKQSVAAAGINKNISPHTFRHSFATHLLEGGANIRQIQEMLGHESITTTEIYTHLDRTHLRRSIEKHHPLK